MTAGQAATLFVITAPSGAGKSTLIARLMHALPELTFSVSYTTRPKRAGEQDGVAYHTWAARHAGGSWGTPVLVARDSSSPRLAFDAAGNALAVGSQDDGAHASIWASRFDAHTGWSAARKAAVTTRVKNHLNAVVNATFPRA